MPALPSPILEPLWVQFAALLPTRQVHHPLGCHRRRDEWITLGLADRLRLAVLGAYDRLSAWN
jgi:transposase